MLIGTKAVKEFLTGAQGTTVYFPPSSLWPPSQLVRPGRTSSHRSQARQEGVLPQGCLSRPSAVPWVGTLHHSAKVTKSTCGDTEMPSYHPHNEGFQNVGETVGTHVLLFSTSLTKLEPSVYLPPSTLWQGPESSLLAEGTPSHKWALFYRHNQVSVEKSLSIRKTPSDPEMISLGTLELNRRQNILLRAPREAHSAKLKKREKKPTFSFHSIWSFNWLQKYWPTVVIKSLIYVVLKQGQSLLGAYNSKPFFYILVGKLSFQTL